MCRNHVFFIFANYSRSKQKNLKNELIKTLSHKISVTERNIAFRRKRNCQSNVKRRLYMNIFWLLRGGGPFFGKWWVLVDIFQLVVGGGDGGGWQWVVVGGSEWWWIYFGWWWVVLDGGAWQCVVVDIFWLVVGSGLLINFHF